MSNIGDSVNIKLSDGTAAQLAHQPVEYDAGVTLLPGHYTIKFLARDDETGRLGTFQTLFSIPNLNKVVKQIPISSVVLSNQGVRASDVIYNTTHRKYATKNDAANPLVRDGQKLIPSVTRVFKTDKELYIFLEAYTAAASQTLLSIPARAEPILRLR